MERNFIEKQENLYKKFSLLSTIFDNPVNPGEFHPI
jgi:hypothetical protein